jgi:hypothetical protein
LIVLFIDRRNGLLHKAIVRSFQPEFAAMTLSPLAWTSFVAAAAALFAGAAYPLVTIAAQIVG